MEGKQKITEELKTLKELIYKIKSTKLDKTEARDLKFIITRFNESFSINFPASKSYYIKNRLNEVNISDGLDDLDKYISSNLKQKDNHYFYSGVNKIKNGITDIIEKLGKSIDSK